MTILFYCVALLLTCPVTFQKCGKNEECDMRNGYKCSDDRCHAYHFCNTTTSKCQCPNVDTNAFKETVCGTDHKVYPSQVALYRRACMDYSDLRILKLGDCNIDTKSKDEDKTLPKEKNPTAVVIPILISFLVVAILAILGWFYYQKRMKNKFTVTRRSSDKNDDVHMML